MSDAFRFVVKSMMRLSGPSTVLAGVVQEGDVALGDRAELRSPSGFVEVRVRGIERDRRLLTEASAGEEVALAVDISSLEAISDGVCRLPEGAFNVSSLVLVPANRRWWQVWRPRAGQHGA